MSAALNHLLKTLKVRRTALAPERSLLATIFANPEGRRLQATLQTLPPYGATWGVEAMDCETFCAGPLTTLVASDQPSTFLLTPALAVLSYPEGDILRRLDPTPHPGPSFVGCLPGSALDWAPASAAEAIRRLARAAARHLDDGTWDLSRPPSAHQRLALASLPSTGFHALARITAMVGGHARIRLLVSEGAAAIVFQRLPLSGFRTRCAAPTRAGHALVPLLPGPSLVVAAVAEAGC